MKNCTTFISTIMIFLLSMGSDRGESKRDTLKIKPQYEYAILTFRSELKTNEWPDMYFNIIQIQVILSNLNFQITMQPF